MDKVTLNTYHLYSVCQFCHKNIEHDLINLEVNTKILTIKLNAGVSFSMVITRTKIIPV